VKKRKAGTTWRRKAQDERLFTLDVSIISGPMTEEFLKKNKVISRTIRIQGEHTLEELHYAIFDAFDREDQHMYEFQVGGKGSMDPKARRYVLSRVFENLLLRTPKPAGDLTRTTIGSLGLKVKEAFWYWFDFGDDWWHQVNVVAIEDQAPPGEYPTVTKGVGESPPQYADWEEEDDE
jgi:hypothetical protein